MNRPPLPGPLLLPGRSSLPVLISVPHAGRDYPDWLIALSRRGRATLEPLEDPLVDRLVWRALALGIPAVIARAPRAAIDCNRAPHEIEPDGRLSPPLEEPGPRARAGLGLVPSRTNAHGDLWHGRIGADDLARRRAEAWAPYHQAVADGLDAIECRHGAALLIDCHSMPPRARREPGIVIGDRHGTSAAPFLSARAGQIVRAAGYGVAFNDPYAGGYIAQHHGRPAVGRNVLQIEIDRSYYLDARLRAAGDGFDKVARLIESLAAGLGQALTESVLPIAAE